MTLKELLYLSIKKIYSYRIPLLKALMLPLIMSILLDFIASVWSGILINVIYYVFTLMLQTIIAITIHRMILLGPSHVPEWGIIKWAHRETVFIFHVLALFLMVFLFMQLMQFRLVGAIIFIMLIIVYLVFIVPRLSLVFPAIAIGDKCTFKNSWFFTQDYQKLMFFSTILIPLVVSIPELLIRNIPHTFLISSLLSNLTIIIGVSSLSLSYKFIKKAALNR